MDKKEKTERQAPKDSGGPGAQSRRGFLSKAAAVAGGTAAIAMLEGCGPGHRRAGGNPNRRWSMIIDLQRCIACKSCFAACKNENKTPPGVAYMVNLLEEVGRFPHVSQQYFPRPCFQCTKSSCAKVCPTSATYHRADGIVAVDYERCIGCRYCIAACPYGARSFDYGHNYVESVSGEVPAFLASAQEGDNAYNLVPSSEYGARYGVREKGRSPIGNVRKCTFCLHLQDEKGEYRDPPACGRSCMGRAIHFGDLKNPEGTCIIHGEKMQELLGRRFHHRLKEELGNEPSVYYLT